MHSETYVHWYRITDALPLVVQDQFDRCVSIDVTGQKIQIAAVLVMFVEMNHCCR